MHITFVMYFFKQNIDYEEWIVRRRGPEKQVLLERIEAFMYIDQEYHRERFSISDRQIEDYRMDREAEREKSSEKSERKEN